MRSWRGSICIETRRERGSTRLSALQHEGPLRIQRPFSQDDGSCHIYLIHPPGGVVGGDALYVEFEGHENTNTLITSSAASKFYSCEAGFFFAFPERFMEIDRHTSCWITLHNVFGWL